MENNAKSSKELTVKVFKGIPLAQGPEQYKEHIVRAKLKAS